MALVLGLRPPERTFLIAPWPSHTCTSLEGLPTLLLFPEGVTTPGLLVSAKLSLGSLGDTLRHISFLQC